MIESDRIPRPGQFYKHFKNNIYQIISIAIHSETREEMVVYQALYGTFQVYVRPLSMFISEVDHEKYPDVEQTYRFELVDVLQGMDQKKKDDTSIQAAVIEDEASIQTIMKDEGITPSIDVALLDFLDANTCKDKLNVLLGMKHHLTEQMLSTMMIAMDLPVLEGTMEEHFEILKDYLQTRVRFESNRLR